MANLVPQKVGHSYFENLLGGIRLQPDVQNGIFYSDEKFDDILGQYVSLTRYRNGIYIVLQDIHPDYQIKAAKHTVEALYTLITTRPSHIHIPRFRFYAGSNTLSRDPKTTHQIFFNKEPSRQALKYLRLVEGENDELTILPFDQLAPDVGSATGRFNVHLFAPAPPLDLEKLLELSESNPGKIVMVHSVAGFNSRTGADTQPLYEYWPNYGGQCKERGIALVLTHSWQTWPEGGGNVLSRSLLEEGNVPSWLIDYGVEARGYYPGRLARLESILGPFRNEIKHTLHIEIPELLPKNDEMARSVDQNLPDLYEAGKDEKRYLKRVKEWAVVNLSEPWLRVTPADTELRSQLSIFVERCDEATKKLRASDKLSDTLQKAKAQIEDVGKEEYKHMMDNLKTYLAAPNMEACDFNHIIILFLFFDMFHGLPKKEHLKFLKSWFRPAIWEQKDGGKGTIIRKGETLADQDRENSGGYLLTGPPGLKALAETAALGHLTNVGSPTRTALKDLLESTRAESSYESHRNSALESSPHFRQIADGSLSPRSL